MKIHFQPTIGILHFQHCLMALEGQYLKNQTGPGRTTFICQLFKKVLSAYMENTLNGEKSIKIVKKRSTREKF
jgi:hypothetical protein